MKLKNVLHIAKSPCAGAPGNLNDCLNKYSYYTSKVFCQRPDINIANFITDYQDNLSYPELPDAIEWAHIVHFHNCTHEDFNKYKFINKPLIYQLHSESRIKRNILQKYRPHCITIAQKHATLYNNPIYLVPNIFDIYDKKYMPGEKSENKVVIFYSSTSVVQHKDYENTCGGKGYTETLEILENIKKKYKDKVEVLIFLKTDKSIVLEAKRKSDIVIDECVTGGYHLTSLEGLSKGCITINALNKEVEKIFRKISNYSDEKTIPFHKSSISKLYINLQHLIDYKLNHKLAFVSEQENNRKFMEDYWHPAKMVEHFERLYDDKLGQNSNPYKGLKYSGDLDRVRGDRIKIKKIYNQKNFDDLNKVRNGRVKTRKRYSQEKFDNTLNSLDRESNKNLNYSALILGLGPSVNRSLDKIEKLTNGKNNFVFTCNYYYKKFEKQIADYWCCIDSGAFNGAIDNISKDAIVVANLPVTYKPFENWRIWLTDHIDIFNKEFKTGIEIERPFTVATIMLMMAIYYEYNPIYIAGVDLSLSKTDTNYCYEGKEYNNKFRSFENNYKWIIKEFRKLKTEAEIRGIKVYNLDPEPENFNVFPILKEL